ncbi:restriction endonuclease subunit S [Clostridium luticellarii]|uniref:Type-1 restriction enzyme EcoKI specificity protein n=1 Tax=Clostridium luticellarii TaxID=1691940 RepID=A0A2T0B828_9CLOT|nr:restriction endonuclease subunit S [Clostridium luticellarii]PRR80036.1 Type-1 restriction enzyme EcoKI specificity protein [Clostridium luticellarii]
MDKNKANVPKIRFPGFTDPWEQRKLGDVGEFKNGMNFSKDAMGHGYPFVNLQNVFGRNIVESVDLGLAESTDIQRRDYSLEKGDVLFIRSSVKPEGVGEAAIVPKTLENTTYSGFIIRFRPFENMSDSFNAVVYSTKSIRNQILMGATSSANTNINQETLQKLQISIPEINEQEKIGAFFNNFTNLIALHQRKLNHLQDKKKGLLQKMFPKNGEDFPELRFPGFTDPWEQRKFCDYYKICSGYAFKYQDYVDDGVTIVNGESIQHGKVDSAKFNYLPESFRKDYLDFLLYEGDIVVGLNRPIIDGKLKISRIPRNLDGSLLYQRAGKIKFITDIDVDFSYVLLEKEILKYTRKEAVGSDQPFISTSKLDKWKMMFPKSEDEKVKIGLLFKNFDNLITLHQRKLNHLQEQKKALLQQMFI